MPVAVHPSMESLPKDSELRQRYPDDIYPNGSYFKSPYGRVRYYVIGPMEGEKVVLIHGISVPSIGYKKIANALAERGFQVLLFDLYGRGYSEAPTGKTSSMLYSNQVAHLLQYVRWNEAYIVGFSMGGAIAAGFCATFPHLVKGKVVLISSAGLIEFPPDVQGERPRGPVSTFKDPSGLAIDLRRLQLEALPGFRQVLESDVKDGPIRGLAWAFQDMNEQTSLKILVIHGDEDDVVPFNEALKIRAIIPRAELVTVAGASHYLLFDDVHWKIVADAILDFLA